MCAWYRIIVEFEFEFEFQVRDGDHLALHCTSKVGVIIVFCKPNVNERGTNRGSDVCAREQTMVLQATPFAVRV